jgi:hypothetical protein
MKACAFAVVRFTHDLVGVPHFDIHPHDYEALQQACMAIYADVGCWFKVTEDGLKYH